MTIQKYAVPRSIEEATQLLAAENITMFAGGTDLMPQTKSGARKFKTVLMNLNRVHDLRGISLSKSEVRIGTLTTVTDILHHYALRTAAGILPEVANAFASGQIRNAATLGGNVCNASPAGDMIIPLLLLDAEVELTSWKNSAISTRRIALHEFFIGPGKTRLGANELLTFIHFRIPEEGFVARFEKFGTRPALDISIVSVGIAGTREHGGLRNARVAFGAVAPIPMRGHAVEHAIDEGSLTAERIKDISRLAEQEITPIDDIRATAWYRKEITRTYTERMLHDICAARN